jgi:hypothetical protein
MLNGCHFKDALQVKMILKTVTSRLHVMASRNEDWKKCVSADRHYLEGKYV